MCLANFEIVQKMVKQCHYEVLGVAMDADDAVIKKAYRKLALEWHPDKNMQRVDEATEKFRFINEAYQVLSDPKERSWYDTHRDAILKGGDGTRQEGEDGEFVPNIFSFFSIPKASDFFEFYAKAFDEIIQAEKDDAMRQNRTDFTEWPLFGDRTTPFAEVKRFYTTWEMFFTKITFAWMDKYDTREAENRYQRRYVEKMNDSERGQAKREYQENVRSLVAYCKKRDERWALGLAQLEIEERGKREKRERAEQERKAQKQAQKEALQRELAEERLKEEEERRARGDLSEEEGSEEEELEHHVWSCLVCKKEFKSEKQMENHETSKKHKDAVKIFLKKGGKVEDVLKAPPEKAAPEGEEACPSCGEFIPNDSKDCPQCGMPVFLGEEQEDEESFEAVDAEDFTSKGEEFSNTFQKMSSKSESRGETTEVEDDDLDDDENFESFVKVSKSAAATRQEGDEDDQESETEEAEMAADPTQSPAATAAAAANSKKVGKAKQKRLEREAKNQAQQKDDPSEVKCAVCGEEFSSRSKLFKHVESLDHAAPLDEVKPSSGTTGKGGKKAKKGKN